MEQHQCDIPAWEQRQCGVCGCVIRDDENFCAICGADVVEHPAASAFYGNGKTLQYGETGNTYGDDPKDYARNELISTGAFVGILLLMCVPVVNLIFLIVWACGGCKKFQKRYYARAMLIVCVISVVLFFITFALVAAVYGDVIEEFFDAVNMLPV